MAPIPDGQIAQLRGHGARWATSAAPSLMGRCIPVAEDDSLVAEERAHGPERKGAEEVEPAPTVGAALAPLDAQAVLDGAVPGIDRKGEQAHPVAEARRRRGGPFIFATGHEAEVVDPRFAGVPPCPRPVSARQLAEALALPLGEGRTGPPPSSRAGRSRP